MGLKFIVTDKKMRKILKNGDYFKSHVRWMQLVGIWPLDILQNKSLSKWATVIWYTVWQLISIHFTVLHFLTISTRFSKGGTLDNLSGLLMSAMIYAYTYYITIYFQVRHSSFRRLITFLLDHVRLRSAYGLTYLTIVPSYRAMYKKNTFWLVACLLGTVHWSLTPIFMQDRSLPLNCDYPFDPFVSPRYEIIYFLQFLGQIQVGTAFGISGGLFMSTVLVVSGQFDLLFCSLKNLRATAMIFKGDYGAFKNLQNLYNPLCDEQSQYDEGNECLEDIELIKDSSEIADVEHLMVDQYKSIPIRKVSLKPKDNYLVEYRDELHVALVDCIRHHQSIKKMAQMIEDTYYSFAFGKLFQITFLICFLAFIVSRTNEINMQVVNLLEYLSLTTSELFLFCYFGELISRQSVRIPDAAMRSAWYLCNGSFRRMLQIMMSCSLRPIHLTGGKFYMLNFESYRSVITASFSYYTLLKNFGQH